jgi:hypothetical protein
MNEWNKRIVIFFFVFRCENEDANLFLLLLLDLLSVSFTAAASACSRNGIHNDLRCDASADVEEVLLPLMKPKESIYHPHPQRQDHPQRHL